MPAETQNFEDASGTYRIQFDIVPPPFKPPAAKGAPKVFGYVPPAEFKVLSIRITELTGEQRKKNVQFDRGYATLAQARSQAGEYAKRIIREKMTARAPAAVAPAATEP